MTTPDNGQEMTAPTFVKFLGGMAHQALLQLGELPNPMSGQREAPNPAVAAYTVAILRIHLSRRKIARQSHAREDHYLTSMVDDLGGRVAKAAAASDD